MLKTNTTTCEYDPAKASEVYELETPKDFTGLVIWLVVLSILVLIPICCWRMVKEVKRRIEDKLEDYGVLDDNVNSEQQERQAAEWK